MSVKKAFKRTNVSTYNRELEMKGRLPLLKAVFRFTGNFNVHSLEGRIVIQKTIYFLQALVNGLDLGYSFSWYIHGPYSTKLMAEAFETDKKWNRIRAKRLSDMEIEILNRLFVFLGDRSNDAVWLELLGSIHLLKTLAPSRSKEEIIGATIRHQNYFDIKSCQEAWKYLDDFHLIPCQ